MCYKLCSSFSPSLLFLGPQNKLQSSGPSPDFHQWQSSRQHCSRAALRYYLTASLLQLDFDKEDEADQGDHDKESQENPHVKVFCGLLEQKTDTVSHGSLSLRINTPAVLAHFAIRIGYLGYASPHFQEPPGVLLAHTWCAIQAQIVPSRVAGGGLWWSQPGLLEAKTTQAIKPNSLWNSMKFAVTGRRGPSK